MIPTLLVIQRRSVNYTGDHPMSIILTATESTQGLLGSCDRIKLIWLGHMVTVIVSVTVTVCNCCTLLPCNWICICDWWVLLCPLTVCVSVTGEEETNLRYVSPGDHWPVPGPELLQLRPGVPRGCEGQGQRGDDHLLPERRAQQQLTTPSTLPPPKQRLQQKLKTQLHWEGVERRTGNGRNPDWCPV